MSLLRVLPLERFRACLFGFLLLSEHFLRLSLLFFYDFLLLCFQLFLLSLIRLSVLLAEFRRDWIGFMLFFDDRLDDFVGLHGLIHLFGSQILFLGLLLNLLHDGLQLILRFLLILLVFNGWLDGFRWLFVVGGLGLGDWFGLALRLGLLSCHGRFSSCLLCGFYCLSLCLFGLSLRLGAGSRRSVDGRGRLTSHSGFASVDLSHTLVGGLNDSLLFLLDAFVDRVIDRGLFFKSLKVISHGALLPDLLHGRFLVGVGDRTHH